MFSATDLASFLACHHTATLGLAESRKEIKRPFFDDPSIDLLKRLGLEHESRYLQYLTDKEAAHSHIDDMGDLYCMKKIGFLSFGHWTPSPQSQARSATDVLLQSIDLAVEAERLGMDGAYFRVHHFAQQLASPFPLLAAVGVKTRKIEIGTAVIDMRYENPHYMVEDAGAADLIAGGRLQLGISRGSPEQVIDGWRYFGYRPNEGEDDADMGRRHPEEFLELLQGKGFAQPNPRPMFTNPPGLLRLEPHSAELRDRI